MKSVIDIIPPFDWLQMEIQSSLLNHKNLRTRFRVKIIWRFGDPIHHSKFNFSVYNSKIIQFSTLSSPNFIMHGKTYFFMTESHILYISYKSNLVNRCFNNLKTVFASSCTSFARFDDFVEFLRIESMKLEICAEINTSEFSLAETDRGKFVLNVTYSFSVNLVKTFFYDICAFLWSLVKVIYNIHSSSFRYGERVILSNWGLF